MRLPRGLTGAQLVRALGRLGNAPTRQTGRHVRLTRPAPAGHHLTIPLHDPLRVGTLAAVLAAVAEASGLEREALLRKLFD